MLDELHDTERQHDGAKVESHTSIQRLRQEKIKNKDLSERIQFLEQQNRLLEERESTLAAQK